ncbi:MAG: AIR synthase family protein [Vicinamibacterales bacterium]|jgi:hydrogenase maturation factor
MSESLPVGKLPAAQLDAMLRRLPRRDPRVVLGPRLGEDAAVLDLDDRYLVAASDPVTFASDRIGWYAVHVNANDVAVLGATPRWFLAVVLLPEGTSTAELAAGIMADVASTCDALDVTVCGGHTEITAGLDRPIVIGQMLGEVSPARLVRKDRVQVGDQVILTHGAAIEGTALLAREKRAALASSLTPDLLSRAEAFLDTPGLSIVSAARVASGAGDIHAMHDPTEGGIQTALTELAAASGHGLEVWIDRIPVLAETRAVCDHFKLEPLKLLASGALLIATPPATTEAVTAALSANNIPASVVAEARPASFGVMARKDGQLHPLAPAERDEISRLFEADGQGP